MSLNNDVLARLYERLIRQSVYPGQTCAVEHVLIAHESAALPEDQARWLAAHLVACSSCQEDLTDLQQAAQWFREYEATILMGLAAKGASTGTMPWAKCPSSQLLYRYVNGQIPGTVGGETLLGQMQEHLSRCCECLHMSEQLRETKSSVCLSILDIGARVGYAVQNQLVDFIDALIAVGDVLGGPAWVRGAPGYRSGETPTLSAGVVDANGQLIVDDEGRPQQCGFNVIQADIHADGFLTLALAATDRAFCQTTDVCYQANAAILAGGVRLDLSPTLIDEEGRVTFTGMLGKAEPVDPLPLSTIDIIVCETATQPTENNSDD